MTRYRSKHHPENGVTYIVVGDTLCATGPDGRQTSYPKSCWDWSDLERIED